MNKVIKKLLRDDIRRTLSGLLMDTDEDNKEEIGIWLNNGSKEVKVAYAYQVPCSGEIGVVLDYFGYSEEKDLDDLPTDWQRQILDWLLGTGVYKPYTLMEKGAGRKATPIIVVGLHMLRGGACWLIDDALREHLGDELSAYERKAEGQGIAKDGFRMLTKDLSAGKGCSFLGRRYYFEYIGDK